MGSQQYSVASTDATVGFIQPIPNSHFWNDLNQIVNTFDFHIDEIENKEYILIGLSNTMKNGYYLNSQNINIPTTVNPYFQSINQMIEYVKSTEYNKQNFYIMVVQTLNYGINFKSKLKMERKEIYKCLDGERDYQDANWGSRRQMDGTPDEQKPVAEWLNYIEYHLSKAKEKVYLLDTVAATAELRKIGALAVRAMEIHGCPEREK